MVLFDVLGMVSYYAIVTVRKVSLAIRLQKCLENRAKGPSKSLEISPFDRARMTSY